MANVSIDNQEKPLLTFNALYNILRTEKKEKTLQKFPELFYEALEDYFKEKKEEIKRLKEEKNIDRLKKETHILRNSTRIAKELIGIRVQKIAKIASHNSLLDEEIIDAEHILEKEKELYGGVVKHIKKLQGGL